MKPTTIFKQLILNIIFPVVVALFILGGLNYVNTQKLLTDFNNRENKNISEEILNYLELQDLAFSVLEGDLDVRLRNLSESIVSGYFKGAKGVGSVDLQKIRRDLEMDTLNEDIYVINKKGIVVNSTFKRDLGLDFFSFGEGHRSYLLKILDDNVYRSERFAIEAKTNRIKKYSYHSCGGEYIVELGVYSKTADGIVGKIKSVINQISNNHEIIESVDLFIGGDDPFSMNRGEKPSAEQAKMLVGLFSRKADTSFQVKKDGRLLDYDCFYLKRQNTHLYKNAVVQIVSDRQEQRDYLRVELVKLLLIFLITIAGVIYIIYTKTKVITLPIKRLVSNVTRIAKGNFNERALVEGNNEITKLSEHFNFMLEKIEGYYNELERKVEERTCEVRQQKEEIEAQNDDLSEKNEYLQVAYKKIETQNKNITDSIHYAERIQRAILPPKSTMDANLSDYFVLYQPKDIVSGDFYWTARSGDYSYVAAVDCTGHGVPGAFMSIIGNENLNQSIKQTPNATPASLLNELNSKVTNALNQDPLTKKVKDGMDMTLCAIDTQKKVVQFAGANNPIYFVSQNELRIIKGDKFPIGAFAGEALRDFTNHEIAYTPGDILYLFSDGFADQFGGPRNKKFMYKQFRELLLGVSSLPMENQREKLLDHFYLWKGDESQVDDVLVIGIRLM